MTLQGSDPGLEGNVMASKKKDWLPVAIAAVKSLAKERGEDAEFPFDAIWKYAKQDVPSTARPPLRAKLVKSKHIEQVPGVIVKTENPTRRSNNVAAYRLGPNGPGNPGTPVPARCT